MQEYTFLPTEEFVRPLGRTHMLEDCRILSLSASGVEFSYEGNYLGVTFYGDATTEGKDATEPWRNQARVMVFVDGTPQLDTVIRKPVEKYAVYCDQEWQAETPAEKHIVRIVKLSEPRMSTIGLGEITIRANAPAQPTASKDKLIEFVGDSITCGYGIDAVNEWQCFSTTTENATKAFAYRTAEKLSVDYSMVSYSGHGLISGYTADPEKPLLTELVPPYYEILSYCFNTFRGMNMSDISWDFEAHRTPDMIVVNLGTNDDSYILDTEEKRIAFEDAYVSFLEQLHRKNPKAKLVSVFGLMGDRLYPTEEKAIQRFKEKTGFEEAYSYHIEPQDAAKYGYGSDWHPSETSHEIAAEGLAAYLKNIL